VHTYDTPLTALFTDAGITDEAADRAGFRRWTAAFACELDGVTDRMRRLLADRSTSRDVLAETGRTRKIRNVAKSRGTAH